MFLIARDTGTATATSFTGIPQGYHGLRVVFVGASVAAAATDAALLLLNGNAADYSWQVGYASAATATAIEDTSDTWVSLQTAALAGMPGADAGNEANTVGVIDIMIWNYTSTVFNKIVTATIAHKTVASTGGMDTGLVMGMWAPATPVAITSLSISSVSARKAGSSVSLYGIP